MKGAAAMHAKTSLISVMALFSLASVCAFGAHVKGMINGRTGETLTVASDSGNTTVLLTEGTTTKDDTGLFGLGNEKMASVVLIPGLKVDVEGESNGEGQFVAQTITVDGDDLETSEMIQAGVNPTAKQVEANIESIDANRRAIEANKQSSSANAAEIAALKAQIAALLEEHKQNAANHEQKISETIKVIHETTDRFMSLADYDVKAKATVKFGSGSSSLSKESEAAIKTLVDSASGLKGYLIEVVGYADSTGHESINTKLSEDRARAVISYLIQQGGVPVRHIVAPGAMGEYAPVASNETAAGRAENRRVEAKVLVHKGAAAD
jgi:outer membrane protein OmpA-like peptidoglycan-associated protein